MVAEKKEEEEEKGRGQQQVEKEKEKEKEGLCDFCEESKAVVYCRADSARLCLGCDRHVHAANTVSSKHPRSLLCDLCRSAPSSILCSSHRLVLCANCDFDVHNNNNNINLSAAADNQHDRRAVEPFFGCPSASEMASHFLGAGLIVKEKKEEEEEEENDEMMQFGVWETPPVVRLEDLIIQPQPPPPHTHTHPNSFQAIISHSPPRRNKNQNFTCGKQKEELLQQLHVLMKSEAQLNNDCEQLGPIEEFLSLPSQENVEEEDNLHFDFDGDSTFMVMPTYEDDALLWTQNDWHEAVNPMFCGDEQTEISSAVIAPFPDGIEDNRTSVNLASINDKYPVEGVPLTHKGGVELLCPDRDSAISRYKEKRKTRRYDKLIRYESRKARADSRVRINGRFAKVNHVPKS